MSVCCTLVSWIALALLTTMSTPPHFSAVASSAFLTLSSSRTSTTSGSASPPAASISAAAVWIVPGSFGCGVSVLAAIAMLAPSRAARRPIASPMPRDAPVMNSVLPFNDMAPPGNPANGPCRASQLLARQPTSAPTEQRGRHAAHRHSSPNRDLGRRGRQQALLHWHNGHAHGEEDRQSGRHLGLSLVLRRRAGAARHRPHLLRLACAAGEPRHARDRAHGPARHRAGEFHLVEGALERSRREERRDHRAR